MSPARLALALLFILLGVIFLAANLGWLEWGFVAILWRLWPLLLVALGIHFLFGRARSGLAGGLILATFVVGIGVAVFAWQADWVDAGVGVTDGTIQGAAADGVEGAELILDVGALDLTVEGGAERIVEGEYALQGELDVTEGLDGSTYRLRIAQQDDGFAVFPFVPFVTGSDQFVDLALGSDAAWDLTLDVGAARVDIDLRESTLSFLSLNAGASSVDLRVGPDVTDGAEVLIDGGAGSYDVWLPEGLTITLRTDTGLSSTDIDDQFEERGGTWVYEGGGRDLEVTISAGVSSIDIQLYEP